MKSRYYRFILLVATFNVITLCAEAHSVTGRAFERNSFARDPYHQYFGDPTFLNLSFVYNGITRERILKAPPAIGSIKNAEDEKERAAVYNGATDEEVVKAVHEEDGIFSFAAVLGSHFNAEELPKTKRLFQEIYADSHMATTMAKNFFKRPRPLRNDGYSYPSAHSTRAFLWKALLVTIFTDDATKTALENKAWEKAWDRVILGRHYPADVEEGRMYGEYLCYVFLQNPEFCEKWREVAKEIRRKVNPVKGENVNPAEGENVNPAEGGNANPVEGEKVNLAPSAG